MARSRCFRRARCQRDGEPAQRSDVERSPEDLRQYGYSRDKRAKCAHAKAITCRAPTSPGKEPERLWSFYIQVTEVEQAFKELKHDLAVRPIYHRKESRIEAHIFVAFPAYCLQVTLKAKLHLLTGGITPHEVLAKFKTIQLVDVRIPTTDGRELLFSRYPQPEVGRRMLLAQRRLTLPQRGPPKISAKQVRETTAEPATA